MRSNKYQSKLSFSSKKPIRNCAYTVVLQSDVNNENPEEKCCNENWSLGSRGSFYSYRSSLLYKKLSRARRRRQRNIRDIGRPLAVLPFKFSWLVIASLLFWHIVKFLSNDHTYHTILPDTSRPILFHEQGHKTTSSNEIHGEIIAILNTSSEVVQDVVFKSLAKTAFEKPKQAIDKPRLVIGTPFVSSAVIFDASSLTSYRESGKETNSLLMRQKKT
mmetsp:Transcript_18254/g.27022  ORF Transcript_18254/g.27022 Transcript_18254/m.27022 type:complete len:218 (+) Transcript_18254:157-810(+)